MNYKTLTRFKKIKINTLIGVLVFLQVLMCIPAQALGKSEDSSSVMNPLINEIVTPLAPGIEERHLTFTNPQNFRTECFCVNVNLKNKNASILAGTPDDGDTYKLQTVHNQANAAIKNGKNVVAAVNGDYYNMATGEPQGTVIKAGKEIHGNICSEPFFGIKTDGTPIICDSSEYEQVKSSLKEAIGGPRILVKNGTAVHYSDSPYPCEAVGIRKDNSVFFLCIDGAQYPYSDGIALKDLADLLKDMGAEQALMLDGGGSATCVTRTPGDKELTCKNRPSDGWERTVGNSILIVSNAKSDGKFASAYVTPQDKTYTPKSTVQMEATGLDSSGAPADLPDSGLTWSLSDLSFGTIDKDGLFVSNGKKGQVQVFLKYNGKTVGSTYIELAVPDDLHFASTSLSTDLNKSKSLKLVARYKWRDVNLKDGDISWEIPKGLGEIKNSDVFLSGDKAASGTVSAALNGTSLKAKISITVGQEPVVACDFENQDGYADWYAWSGTRGETCSLGFSTYPDEPVRFGDHALKFNFDFTTGKTKTTLVTYAGPKDHDVKLNGTPTAIGMWVYATPEAQGEWLWTGLTDSNDKHAGIYLTSQQTGINWSGWKYIEAKIPDGLKSPYYIRQGDAIGVLCVKSGMTGYCPMTKGSIYIDNIRAVYGANNDDVTSPVIESATIDGKQYTQSQVDVTAYVHDDTKSNSSGINWNRSKIIVDGKDYSTDKEHFNYDTSGALNLKGISWPDGVHKVTVDIQDNFGNETTKDFYFTVNSGKGTKIKLDTDKSTAVLGGNYKFYLSTNKASDIKKLSAKIKISKEFPVSSVTFDQSMQSGSTYTYDDSTGVLNVNIENDSGNISDLSKLATINVNIPKDTASGNTLECSVQSSSVEYNSDKGDSYASSFSSKPIEIPVTSTYTVKLENPITGSTAKILVTDSKNNPIANTAVNEVKDDGSIALSLGKTDSKGILSNSDLTKSVQKFKLQAENNGNYSFIQLFQTYSQMEDKISNNLMCGTTSDPETEKSITWMSNPVTGKNNAIMQIAALSDYKINEEKAFKNVTGTSTVLYYDSDSSAVRENAAAATGLKSGTEYEYRVGDGTNWSSLHTFTTANDTKQFTFNVFGDTQSTESGGLDDLSNIFTRIEKLSQKPLFTIHVGDFVDDEQIFSEIDTTAKMFNQHPIFNSIDMIHVLGNHEYQGDDGIKGATIYGTPKNGPEINKNGCYSTNYGNMHISVIGWTDKSDVMKKELDWLQDDVKAANKTWNIVATHQPAYNKNPADSGSSMFNEMLPPVCDKLGIDFVFSGHDHSYGRTYSLIGGKKVADGKGTVYVSAGHTAEKTYDISPEDPSVFAYVQKNKEDKTYITATVSGNKMTIQAQRPDGSVVDSYSATAKPHADKSKLSAAIESTETIYDKGNTDGTYTPESWQKFKASFETAQSDNQNTSAEQETVNTDAEVLESTINGLEFTHQGAVNAIKDIDDINTSKSISSSDKPGILNAVKAIKSSALSATIKSDYNSYKSSIKKLETLLEKLTSSTPKSNTPSYASGISANDKMAEAPDVSNLLLATGVTGSEESIPQVTLNTEQIVSTGSNAVFAFALKLTKGNTSVTNLSVPVTVTIRLPNSFVYHSSGYTYTVRHDKEDGTSETLNLAINYDAANKCCYGTFTTDSFSTFTVIAAKNSSGSSSSSSSSHHHSSNSGSTTSVTSTPSTPSTTYVSDTTNNFTVNGSYQFKITSKIGKAPVFTVGTSGVFNVQLVKTSGNDYYFKLTAIGIPNAQAGIYVNGQKLLVATVGSSAFGGVKCDTILPFKVKAGVAYTFKLTAKSKPAFVCGNSSVFAVSFAGQKGSDYFFKAKAVGKAGNSTGFYINGYKVPCVVAAVS